jgi:predicted DNA-binding protein (MmcQ/YjbR family)
MVDLAFPQCNQLLNKVLKSRESLVYKAKRWIWLPPWCACTRRFRIICCQNSANHCTVVCNVLVNRAPCTCAFRMALVCSGLYVVSFTFEGPSKWLNIYDRFSVYKQRSGHKARYKRFSGHQDGHAHKTHLKFKSHGWFIQSQQCSKSRTIVFKSTESLARPLIKVTNLVANLHTSSTHWYEVTACDQIPLAL